MNSKEFKLLLGKIANDNQFERAFGGWYKKDTNHIYVLYLQKSNYGNYYYLNIGTYIQGLFDTIYAINKDTIQYVHLGGHIWTQLTNREDMNLENSISDSVRQESLENLFQKFINPFLCKTSSISGIMELEKKGDIYLFPAVKEELKRVYGNNIESE